MVRFQSPPTNPKVQDSDAEEKDFHLLALLDENDFVGYERPLDTKEGSVT